MHYLGLISAAVAFMAFGLLDRRIGRTVVTGPMLFAGFGYLAGPAGLDLMPLEIGNTALHLLAEVTLVIILFSDAAAVDLRHLRKDAILPTRMLLIGLPLTLLLGALTALWLLPDLMLWEAFLLAAILAPTDAALGQAVVSNDNVPIRIRHTLTVESGLNDGLALPFVLIFAALATGTSSHSGASEWLVFGLKQVTLGPLAGASVGFVGAKLVALCYARGWMSDAAEGICALAMAFGAFALAESMHGNGFIAAFVAGLTLSNVLRRRCAYLYEFAETEGTILVLATFMFFGGAMIPMMVSGLTPMGLAYGLASLSVIRLLPVALSLLGTGVRIPTTGFLGWFGPRGLASVLFVLLIVREHPVPGQQTITDVVVFTVVLSIVLHGLSAVPAANAYGRWVASVDRCPERQPMAAEPFPQNPA